MADLSGVKACDLVIMTIHGDGRRPPEVKRVARTTKTMVVLDGGERFRHDGSQVGRARGWWKWMNIRLPEPGEIETVRENEQRRSLAVEAGKVKWSSLSLDQLRRVLDIVREATT